MALKERRRRQLIPLEFAPGVVKDATADAPRGFWKDTQLVRFRLIGGRSFVEKMGGWLRFTTSIISGTVRTIHRYVTLNGETLAVFGSNERLMIDAGDGLVDVTPYRATVTGLTNPFATVNGTPTITVTTVSPHEALVGDEIVIASSPTVNGITGANINGLRTITSVISGTQFTFDAAANATSTGSGGTGVVLNFVLGKVPDGATGADGWGVGPWSREGWGEPSLVAALPRLQVWSFDNYGEDLVACRRGSGLYYMDYTNWPARLVAVSSLPGATDVPAAANIVMVSERDRHVIAFGTVPFAGSSIDPLTIRWSNQEDAANWDAADTTTTSGEIRLSRGVQIVAAKQTRQEIMVWTDNSLYSMRYQGGPGVFAIDLIGEGTDIAGQNAGVSYNDAAYWVGRGGFYAYNGQVQPLECPIFKWFQDRVDWDNREKIVAGLIRSEGEIIWFYPSEDDDGECDSYVIYNTKINCWYTGALNRTAWFDNSVGSNPIAAASDGYIYEHENGFDDDSQVPAVPISAWAESSFVEISTGQDVMLCDELVPDITFLSSTAPNPSVSMDIYVRDWPGDPFFDTEENQITRTATVPVEQFTSRKSIRVRGRAASLKVSSVGGGVSWRLGLPRFRVRTDGERV